MKFNSADKVVLFCAAIALILSFTARIDFPYTRFFGGIWNFGHVAAFYVWTYLCLRLIPALREKKLISQFIVVLFSTLIFGITMEIVQKFIGRSAEFSDLISDLSGSGLAFLVHSNRMAEINRIIRGILATALFFFILFMHRTIILMPINDYYTYQQFPVLLNPGTPFESTKLYDDWSVTTEKLMDEEGRSYFDISFSPLKTYSTLMLGYFPLDWSEYSKLEIEFYNPAGKEILLNIRIHDLLHLDNDGEFSDRFNQKLVITPGYNQVVLSIAEIRNAPQNREMDLSKVQAIGLFTSEISAKQQLRIYNIRLVDD